jgi:hypothetical protein
MKNSAILLHNELTKINTYSLEKALADCRVSDGGATIDQNGIPANSPYYASIYPEFEKVVSVDDLSQGLIADYVASVNAVSDGLLTKPNTYLGLWNNPKNGKVYIDISKGFDDRDKVEKACRDYKQLAYFDSEKGESVAVAW